MDDMQEGGGWQDGDRAAMVGLYLETLRLRMDPDQFAALASAFHEFWHMVEAGERERSFNTDDDPAFTDDVRKELMIVMAILNTGRMDHKVVDAPGRDGSPGWAVVTADVADDPEALARLRAQLHSWQEEQEMTSEILAGIEKAGQEPPRP